MFLLFCKKIDANEFLHPHQKLYNHREKQRFVLYADNNVEIGEMTWVNAGESVMIINHTYVDEGHRGKKLAEKLVLSGVKKARKDNKKIMPLCPFAKKEFDIKNEYEDVLKK
ncbi:GNAT family N-acetyltransferase [Vagococcus sp.]|uniref:GNAT family N-acetyltransferase n=1 Tax=Vagococcus sp. TaxID=1933889 RepID=UPI0010EF5B66|nr:N-acetyltransferase [Listeria monocytogenes]EAD4370566.1 N-acetyltransferase [Listeria monocytogenes]